MNDRIAVAIIGVVAAGIVISCIVFFRPMLNSDSSEPAAIEHLSPDSGNAVAKEKKNSSNAESDDYASVTKSALDKDIEEYNALPEPDSGGNRLQPLHSTGIEETGFHDIVPQRTTPPPISTTTKEPEVEMPPVFKTASPGEMLLTGIAPAVEPIPTRSSSSAKTKGSTKPVDAGKKIALAATSREENNVFSLARQFRPSSTIEGYGGGHITPTAYLSELSHIQAPASMPSLSFQFYKFGSRDVESLSISDTFFGRIELSYNLSRLGLGSLDKDIRDQTGRDIARNDVYLHTFNLRGMLVPENYFKCSPAITAGIHFKYNDTIQTIDRRSGNLLNNMGLERSNGIDYTLTLSKTFKDPLFHRSTSVSGGLRFSQAAQLGYLGFGDAYRLTCEGNIFYNPVDNLWLGYEIRQKKSPYRGNSRLIGDEDWWHAFSIRYRLGTNLSISAMYGLFGHFANSNDDNAWGIQLKYKF